MSSAVMISIFVRALPAQGPSVTYLYKTLGASLVVTTWPLPPPH